MYSAAEFFSLPATKHAALLGARVCLACASGARHTGALCSADPLTGALALLQEGEADAGVRVVTRHGLTSLTVLAPAAEGAAEELESRVAAALGGGGEEAPSPAPHPATAPPPADSEDFAARRAAAQAVLKRHLLPCSPTPEGHLLVLGCLTLRWPFTAADAECANPRVLERVVAALPADWA